MKNRIALGLTNSMILAVLVCGFQNCAKGLPDNIHEVQAASTTPQTSPLALTNAPAQVIVGQTAVLWASGGTPPYTFVVDSGPAAIVNQVSLQAGSAPGIVDFHVTDSIGNLIHSSISVVADPTPPAPPVPAPASCTLPWGGTLAHNAAVTAYQTSSVACMGGTCLSETRICINGALSGSFTAQSCAVPACVYGWYNASYKESQSAACARNGKPVATDQGYGVCASGENRPIAGLNLSSIVYSYGTYGGTGGIGQIVPVTTSTTTDYMCYRAGQKRDGDFTDVTVAYLCREN